MTLKAILTGRDLAEGAMMPRGYGVAYWRWDLDQAVCYPVPFNKLIGWCRRAYAALRSAKPDRIAKLTAESRQAAWRP